MPCGGRLQTASSPYTFPGLGEEGLELIAEASQVTGIAGVGGNHLNPPNSDIMRSRYVVVIQVGARNMQNFALFWYA